MCVKMPRNRQKSPFSPSRVRLSILCLVEHIADKGVTWRRVALAKNRWKKRKVEEGEGKVLEMWKKRKKRRKGEKGEKRENWRKNGKNGGQSRKGENMREGKVGKPRGPQACYMISQTSLEFCLSCPVHHVRTASEKYKNDGKSRKNANLSRAHTGSSSQTDRNGTFTGPEEGHTCSPLSQNQQTSHKKHGKKYNYVQN